MPISKYWPPVLASSMFSGCFHSGSLTTSTVSDANALLTTLSESPRSALKPMVSFTRLLTCSSSVAVNAFAVRLPCASTAPR